MRGIVAKFNNRRGWGFIGQEDGPDVFVHYSAIQAKGFKKLNTGDEVEFEIVTWKGRAQAANVFVLPLTGPPKATVTVIGIKKPVESVPACPNPAKYKPANYNHSGIRILKQLRSSGIPKEAHKYR